MNENKNLNECTLAELLDKLSGIFDIAYIFAETQEEKDYICNLEEALGEHLRQEGIIE